MCRYHNEFNNIKNQTVIETIPPKHQTISII